MIKDESSLFVGYDLISTTSKIKNLEQLKQTMKNLLK